MNIRNIDFELPQNKNNKRNLPNFGAIKIDSINLLKRTGNGFKPIKADFLELQVNNRNDISLIKKLFKQWGGITNYTMLIYRDFMCKLKTSRFFATVIKEADKDKITSLLEISFVPPLYAPPNWLELKYLQAAPEIADKKEKSPIKGSGEISLYEMAKIAKDCNAPGFMLYSSNDRFYDKAGMDFIGVSTYNTRMFATTADMYDEFMQRIADKYGLNAQASDKSHTV